MCIFDYLMKYYHLSRESLTTMYNVCTMFSILPFLKWSKSSVPDTLVELLTSLTDVSLPPLSIFDDRDSRFRLIESTEFEFNDLLTRDPSLEDISRIVDAQAPLKEKMNMLKTVYLVTVLEDVTQPNRALVVANTHLYFHPPAAHIRLIQMEVLLRQLKRIIKGQEAGILEILRVYFPSKRILQIF